MLPSTFQVQSNTASFFTDHVHLSYLQVQPWIVRAIGSKLIEGKIDQVAATVTITRCHHRTFTNKEWSGLGQQLASLREALQVGLLIRIMQLASGPVCPLLPWSKL